MQTATRLSPFNPAAARAAHAARAATRAHWATLDLRQQWADESAMRAHLIAAGIKAPDRSEPATIPRLLALLRRAGVSGEEGSKAVDGREDHTTVQARFAYFLAQNPRLPLWAAVALVLEATGRFAADAAVRIF